MARRFTKDEHGVVTTAVAQAERGTDGEIVTIVTDWSDHYHDVSLYYAAAVMLAALGLFAAFPGLLDAKLALLTGGWARRSGIFSWR
jgi:putative membrane protein